MCPCVHPCPVDMMLRGGEGRRKEREGGEGDGEGRGEVRGDGIILNMPGIYYTLLCWLAIYKYPIRMRSSLT